MEQFLLGLIEGNSLFTAWFGFVLMTVLAFVPAMPIPLIASAIGAQYSIPIALLINLGGTVCGSVLMFITCRYFLQDWALRKVSKWHSVTGFFHLLERNGFLAILIGRLIPVLPSAGVNMIAGVSMISLGAFFFATILGKLPTILAFTLAGNQFEDNELSTVILILLYLGILFIVGYKIKRHWSERAS
ncbi:TVP38/TMEM64 family protein [Lysinibacillus sp. LZ02]|uniref:TVP38/TMEM64 family protein n=1 Tax=Lysinibacillus sp. LZ02 TaxID=3420668 RepID=UPI003D366CF9